MKRALLASLAIIQGQIERELEKRLKARGKK